MPQVARQGDTCDHGAAGIDVEGQGINTTVIVNGDPIAISDGTGKGAAGPCGVYKPGDPEVHPMGKSPNAGGVPGPTDGSPTVFAGGLPVHRFNDARGCGAETITASPDVWADFVDKIRIEGATVNNPKPSPAAPTFWAYPDVEFYLFSESNPSLFYVRNASAENKPFHELNSSDFDTWGSTITPTLEFEEITDTDKFKVPDLDRAVRLDKIPKSDPADFPGSNSVFAGGLQAVGFPSFGNAPIETIGNIQGQGTKETWEDFYYVNLENEPNSSPTGFAGYRFKVENESGSLSSVVKLIIIPEPPVSYFDFTTNTGE